MVEFRIRPATPGDATAIARIVARGFAGYREFAPPGWLPPTSGAIAPRMREHLHDERFWCEVAETRTGDFAGHLAFLPASAARRSSKEPGLAHLLSLFVDPPWFGSGLAVALHARGVAAAAERGFTRMRLFTPAEHGRARRFYEREGWTVRGEAWDDAEFGMPLVEYCRRLGPGGRERTT